MSKYIYYKLLFLITIFVNTFFINHINVNAISQFDIVFNEIMWMGSTLSTADEWIELYNNTDNPINLSGFSIEGIKSDNKIFVFGNVILEPKSYFLISNYDIGNSKSILDVKSNIVTDISLSNTKMNYILKDNYGNVIDEVNKICAGVNESNLKKSMSKINFLSSKDCNNWSSATISKNIKNFDKNIATPLADNFENNQQNIEIPLSNTNSDILQNTGVSFLETGFDILQNTGDHLVNENNNTDLIDFNFSGSNIDAKMNNQNDIQSNTGNIIVNNPPIAIIKLQSNTQTSAILSLKVNVTAEGSYDIDGDKIKCDWDYGNGYKIFNNCNPSYYTYTGVGVYEMILTVTDEKGLSGSSSIIFYVYEKPIYSNKIRINEIFANPLGKDIDEWIELYNYDDKDIDLKNYYVQVNSTTKRYLSGTILANNYILLKKQDYGFTIPNNSGGYIKLFDKNNDIVDNIILPLESIEGVSIAYKNGEFEYQRPTPLKENIFINNAPKAVISLQSNKTQGVGKLSVNVISNSYDVDNDIIFCDWDFGDGYRVFNNCNPSYHTYNKGEYDILLVVKDIFGLTGADTLRISVADYPADYFNNKFNSNDDIKDNSITINDKNIYEIMKYCPIYNSGDVLIESIDIKNNKDENFVIKNNTFFDIDLSCLVFSDNKRKKTFAFSKVLYAYNSMKIYAKELGLNFLQKKDNIFTIFNSKNELIYYEFIPYVENKKDKKEVFTGNCVTYNSGDLIIKELNIDDSKNEYFILYNNTNDEINLNCLIFSDGKRKKTFPNTGNFILPSFSEIKITAKDLKLNFLQKKDNVLTIFNINDEIIAQYYYFFQKKNNDDKKDKKNKKTKKNNKDLICPVYNSGDIIIQDIYSGNVIFKNNTRNILYLNCLNFDNGYRLSTGANIFYTGIDIIVPVSKLKIGVSQCKYDYLRIYSNGNFISEYNIPCNKVKNKKRKKDDVNCESLYYNEIDLKIINFNKDKKEFTLKNNSDFDINLRCLRIMYKDKVKKPDNYVLFSNSISVLSQKYFNINVSKTKGEIKIMTMSGELITSFNWYFKRNKSKKNNLILDVKNAFKYKVKSGTKVFSKNANVIVGSFTMSKRYVIVEDRGLIYKVKMPKNVYVNRNDKINIYGKISRSKGNIYVTALNVKINKTDFKNISLFSIDFLNKIIPYFISKNYVDITTNNLLTNNNIYKDVFLHGMICGKQKTYVDVCLKNGEKVILKNVYKYKLKKGDIIDLYGVIIPYGKKLVIAPITKYSFSVYTVEKQKENEILNEYNMYVENYKNQNNFDFLNIFSYLSSILNIFYNYSDNNSLNPISGLF